MKMMLSKKIALVGNLGADIFIKKLIKVLRKFHVALKMCLVGVWMLSSKKTVCFSSLPGLLVKLDLKGSKCFAFSIVGQAGINFSSSGKTMT